LLVERDAFGRSVRSTILANLIIAVIEIEIVVINVLILPLVNRLVTAILLANL
jgi:hypothetical protein